MNAQVVAVNSGVYDMLFQLVADRTQESLERLFRVFNLRCTDDQFEQIFLDLQSMGERERANAEELLLHTVPRTQAAPAIKAIDFLADLPDLKSNTQEQAISKLCSGEKNTLLKSIMQKELNTFKALLNDESATVSAVTAYLAGCAKLSELIDDIRLQLSRRSNDTTECFLAALQMLGINETKEMHDKVKL